MLLPNRAYNATLSSCISSLIAPRFSSRPLTSLSMFSVDADNSSSTSGCGNDMKQSPILYLYHGRKMIANYEIDRPLDQRWNKRTELSRPHRRAPVRWRSLPNPPFPSIETQSAGASPVKIGSLTCLFFSSCSSPVSFWWRVLNLLIFSWSSRRTSISSPPVEASSSFVSCPSLEMHSREAPRRWNTIRRCMFRALRLGHLVLSVRPDRISVT